MPNIAIIVNKNRRYEAYNQDGRMILQRTKWLDAKCALNFYDYWYVTLESRAGKQILDKVRISH